MEKAVKDLKLKEIPKILFLYGSAFSTTGGLEKFNRALCKALSDLINKGVINASIVSAYDGTPDTNYISNNIFYKGFLKSKLKFSLYSIWKTQYFDKLL
jgi:hypothetical protein